MTARPGEVQRELPRPWQETACFKGRVQHNGMVRFRAIFALVLPAALLAGCASPHSRRVPAWEDLATVVPPSPEFPIGGPVEGNPPPPNQPRSAQAVPAPRSTETWVPIQRWSRANGFGLSTQVAGGLSSTYALHSTNGSFSLRAGSQVAQWEGVEVRLGFNPQLIDGQPYVHTLDLYKTVQPLLLGEASTETRANPVIVIDPGHGGENAGTRSVLGGHFEKEFTLDWALRLQSLLAARHFRVLLTRSNDVDLALSNRVAFAADHRADVFISLHFNSASPNETESGLETYCLTPTGMPSTLTRGFADEIQQWFPNNAFDAQNLLLAWRVHRALLQVNGHHDRGIRRARFPGVLRGQQRAAILVEGGYLSNPQEARSISDPAYRQRLAEAVADALLVNNASFAQNIPTDPAESNATVMARSAAAPQVRTVSPASEPADASQ